MALADNKQKSYGLGFAINRKKLDLYRSLLEQCEMGLENRMNIKVGSLSGGQRQALALVIANMTKIELLILDEHTAALDPKSSETMMYLTDKLIRKQGITTLMVTHNPPLCSGIWQSPGDDARGKNYQRFMRTAKSGSAGAGFAGYFQYDQY